MIIKTPVIGIPNYGWSKKACKYVREYANFIELDITNFCYECGRHEEMLKMFDDKNTDYRHTQYWKYYKGVKPAEAVLRKIQRYEKTYNSIKKKGYAYEWKDKTSITVTDDGCRLDGAHRLSILLHLGIYSAKVNVFVYDNLFSNKKVRRIRRNNKAYREKTYGLV